MADLQLDEEDREATVERQRALRLRISAGLRMDTG